MKRFLAYWVTVFAAMCANAAHAQMKATAQNVPEIPYESVRNFLRLPANLYLGEAIGVATNSKGHVFVYTRSANTRLFEFDQNGKYVREVGEGLYGFEFAHSVRVDPEDNIWVVDEGANLVIKFNPEGRVVMVLGHRPEVVAGAIATAAGPTTPAEKYTFSRPTDVAWDPQGNIFVSDGYGNNRVVKYDKNGRFLKQVGSEKTGKEPGQFTLPHAIAADAKGNVYVSKSSTTISSLRPVTRTSARRGLSAFLPGPTSTCSRPTRTQMGIRPAPGISPARFTKWNWTGRSSADSATPASSSGDFRSST